MTKFSTESRISASSLKTFMCKCFLRSLKSQNWLGRRSRLCRGWSTNGQSCVTDCIYFVALEIAAVCKNQNRCVLLLLPFLSRTFTKIAVVLCVHCSSLGCEISHYEPMWVPNAENMTRRCEDVIFLVDMSTGCSNYRFSSGFGQEEIQWLTLIFSSPNSSKNFYVLLKANFLSFHNFNQQEPGTHVIWAFVFPKYQASFERFQHALSREEGCLTVMMEESASSKEISWGLPLLSSRALTFELFRPAVVYDGAFSS